MSSINNKYNMDDCSWIDNIIQEHKKSKKIIYKNILILL